MRIIAGRFKGHPLEAPKGRDTRPTADHVRESIFNLLQSRLSLHGASVLDAFCGTGAFGLEAISRGAERVVFVDRSRQAMRIASSNAGSLDVGSHCRFLVRDATRYLSNPGERFDLIFADPPYSFNRLAELPRLAMAALTAGGLLLLEHDKRHSFDDHASKMESRIYGRTIVSIFQASTSTSDSSADTR